MTDTRLDWPTSCDKLVVLGPHTRDGHTLFAKNSDRPPAECQPLFQVPRARHAPGAPVRCQYVAIPQVEETLAVLGSRPWWLWGFEHGLTSSTGLKSGDSTTYATREGARR
jgi:hypothetical protein